MEVYRKNDCVVISDEIWSDLILKGHEHIPTQSVSEDARNAHSRHLRPLQDLQPGGSDRQLPHYL